MYDLTETLMSEKTPKFGPTIPAIAGAIVGGWLGHELVGRHVDEVMPGAEAIGAAIGFVLVFVVFIVIRRSIK